MEAPVTFCNPHSGSGISWTQRKFNQWTPTLAIDANIKKKPNKKKQQKEKLAPTLLMWYHSRLRKMLLSNEDYVFSQNVSRSRKLRCIGHMCLCKVISKATVHRKYENVGGFQHIGGVLAVSQPHAHNSGCFV